MKKFSKTLRVLRLVFLITLATLGIGITGGIPIVPVYKKDDGTEIKIELFEPQNKNGEDSKIPEVKL
ncbi:hypothetical protein [Rhodohalobacter sp. 614A]|uniref:hypothetical protein n=1 Tax=Rhodohalobacter sp. 614A TaxID=2908649 RepID=UPI001F458BCC|nr:hypothetical protein [Rhodohalobacter sp. 614A]